MEWERQFGELENAQSVRLAQLLEKSTPKYLDLTIDDLATIPTLYDLEQAIRGADVTKAPGVDGLGAELFRQNLVPWLGKFIPYC